MAAFNPDWDIVYLMNTNKYRYCVIKAPQPIYGDEERNKLYVREGCTVEQDGRWHYWKATKPVEYEAWKAAKTWTDDYSHNPNYVVAMRLNKGAKGIPAPRFSPRQDNNWKTPPWPKDQVPMYVTYEMLGNLSLAHLQLCDELQRGEPAPEHVLLS